MELLHIDRKSLGARRRMTLYQCKLIDKNQHINQHIVTLKDIALANVENIV